MCQWLSKYFLHINEENYFIQTYTVYLLHAKHSQKTEITMVKQLWLFFKYN